MSQGYIEHYFAEILTAVRKLEAKFPRGIADSEQFSAAKPELLSMFHAMGSSANKVKWYEQPVMEIKNPCSRFERFHPNYLSDEKFSFGYFQRSLEDLCGDADLMRQLSLLAGEGDEKYQVVKDEQERKRDVLWESYSSVRQKCWFTLAALATVLLGFTNVITSLKAWWLFILFLPPLAGSWPLFSVVFLPVVRPFNVEEPETSWKRTTLDTIYSSIRDITEENKKLAENQVLWEKRWKHGRRGIAAGITISAIIMAAAFLSFILE